MSQGAVNELKGTLRGLHQATLTLQADFDSSFSALSTGAMMGPLTEESLVLTARSMVGIVTSLIQQSALLPPSMVQDVMNSCTQTKEAVIQMLTVAKVAIKTKFSQQSSENLAASINTVLDCVKKVTSLLESSGPPSSPAPVPGCLSPPPSTSAPIPPPSHPPTTPPQSHAPSTPPQSHAPTGPPTGPAPNAPHYANGLGKPESEFETKIVQISRSLLTGSNSLQMSAQGTNTDIFNQALSSFTSASCDLQNLATSSTLTESHADRIREASGNVINAAKNLFGNKSDAVLSDQLKQSTVRLSEHIRAIVLASKSVNPQQSPLRISSLLAIPSSTAASPPTPPNIPAPSLPPSTPVEQPQPQSHSQPQTQTQPPQQPPPQRGQSQRIVLSGSRSRLSEQTQPVDITPPLPQMPSTAAPQPPGLNAQQSHSIVVLDIPPPLEEKVLENPSKEDIERQMMEMTQLRDKLQVEQEKLNQDRIQFLEQHIDAETSTKASLIQERMQLEVMRTSLIQQKQQQDKLQQELEAIKSRVSSPASEINDISAKVLALFDGNVGALRDLVGPTGTPKVDALKQLAALLNSDSRNDPAATDLGNVQLPTHSAGTSLTELQSAKELNDLLSLQSSTTSSAIFSKFQQVSIRNKLGKRFTGVRKPARTVAVSEQERQRVAERESVVDSLINATASFGDSILVMLLQAAACMVAPLAEGLVPGFKSQIQVCRKKMAELLELCKEKTSRDVMIDSDNRDYVTLLTNQLRETIELVTSTDLDGKADAMLVSISSTDVSKRIVEAMLERECATVSKGIRAYLCQLLSVIGAFVHVDMTPVFILELLTTSRSMLRKLESIINCIVTTKQVKMIIEHPATSTPTGSNPSDLAFWDELLLNPKPSLQLTSDNKIRCATLNRLVEKVTSSADHVLMQTFIITMCSFATPLKVFEKVVQRYDVPDKLPDSTKIQVHMRVIVFLKRWIETAYDEFDDTLIAKIDHFASSKFDVKTRDILRTEMARQAKLRETMRQSLLVPQIDILVPQERISPLTYFMEADNKAIAQQLTLIESEVFQAIEPRELMDQAWLQPKLHYRAPHVRQMLNRANEISFWVSQLILYSPKFEDRAAVVTKIIEIALCTRELQNYNTLMGLLAGLNVSPISRLKNTFVFLTDKHKADLQNMMDLMSPSSAFKNYRAAIDAKSPSDPGIPYIGVYLGDLVYIDEGNPNNIDEMINFEKRGLVQKAMERIEHWQSEHYKFPAVEPLYTFLLELPSLPEKVQYDLSLLREPRGMPPVTPPGSLGAVSGSGGSGSHGQLQPTKSMFLKRKENS